MNEESGYTRYVNHPQGNSSFILLNSSFLKAL